MNKLFRVLELIWLGIALIGLGSFVYAMLSSHRDHAVYFLALTAIAGLFYAMRKRQRKNLEKSKE